MTLTSSIISFTAETYCSIKCYCFCKPKGSSLSTPSARKILERGWLFSPVSSMPEAEESGLEGPIATMHALKFLLYVG